MSYGQIDEPIYVISIAARLTNLHPQTLRHYERIGLLKPARTSGNQRVYSQEDLERLRQIVHLTEEVGINLAGVEMILKMREEMRKMSDEMDQIQTELEAEIRRLRKRLASSNLAD